MLEKLVEMSNRYGSDPGYVLAGGGNTSYKDDTVMYIKSSGVSLSSVDADGFVAMDRTKLDAIMQKTYPVGDKEREAAALKDMMDARLPGSGDKRPSVETPLHNLFPYSYVLHVHPALVNGLTCGANGEADAGRLLTDEFVWVPLSRPGYALSKLCSHKLAEHKQRTGHDTQVLLLQNHGIFVAANTVEEIDTIMRRVMDALGAQLREKPDHTPTQQDTRAVADLTARVQGLYSQDMCITFLSDAQILQLSQSRSNFAPLMSAFTPDHIVYCKAKFMYVEKPDEMSQVFELFVRDNGYLPRVICIKDVGAFVVGSNQKEMENARILFMDAVDVAVYSRNFGGHQHMTDELVDFILNWEAESYRQSVATR